MPEHDSLRQRLAANGANIADELLPVLELMAGPLFAALDACLEADVGDAEPFDPLRALLADASARRRS